MENPGQIFTQCLTDLDRDRRTLAGLANQFAAVFDYIKVSVRRGDTQTAIDLLERNRKAVATVCTLAQNAAEQQILLALKLAELTYSGKIGPVAPPAMAEMERGVDAFVLSALEYLSADSIPRNPESSHTCRIANQGGN